MPVRAIRSRPTQTIQNNRATSIRSDRDVSVARTNDTLPVHIERTAKLRCSVLHHIADARSIRCRDANAAITVRDSDIRAAGQGRLGQAASRVAD